MYETLWTFLTQINMFVIFRGLYCDCCGETETDDDTVKAMKTQNMFTFNMNYKT